MPWISTLASGLAVGAARAIGAVAADRAIKLYIENAQGLKGKFWHRTFAEKHLNLNSQQLIEFYSGETPFFSALDFVYVLPISVVVESSDAKLIHQEKITVNHKSIKFKIPDTISIYTDQLKSELKTGKDKRLHNGIVARLSGIETIADHTTLHLEQGMYFDGLVTNFAMDNKPKTVTHSLRQKITKNGLLTSLDTGPLLNHLGVVCLVESLDGFLVVQKRSAKIANRPASLSASVSGAVDWADLRHDNHDLLSITYGAIRETVEELGVDGQQILFLGLIREYLRGGKPEAYFYIKSRKKFSDIVKQRKTAKDSHESSSIMPYELNTGVINSAKDIVSLEKRISTILNDVENKANLTLITGLCLYIEKIYKMHDSPKLKAFTNT